MNIKKRAEANRRNATRSTGPKTSEGKAVSAMNSLKHRLLSEAILLPNEDPAGLAELGERLRRELNPVGEHQSLLVERIIGLYWRLRRLGKIEAGVLTWQYHGTLAERARKKAQHQDPNSVEFDSEPISVLDQHAYDQAVSEQRAHESEQESDTATLGEAFVRDSREENALSKLMRYETSIEHSLYKALHELERRQAAQQGQQVPPPLALDVDVSGIEGPKD
jgi:hypothetical protein